MAVEIARHYDAARVNAVLNHSSVRPYVAPLGEGGIDVSAAVANPNNVLLMGEHGGCLMVQLVAGIYEVHTQVLPEGRGAWTVEMLEAVQYWMFTRTNCVEGVTRVPQGHQAARAAALAVGMRKDFTRPACSFLEKIVPFDIYSITIQDWARRAGGLADRGQWLHDFFARQAERLGISVPLHDDDPNHNRYVGAALDMALAGQHQKAVAFYNRWALVSRHATCALVQRDPPLLKFDIGYLRIREGQIEMTATLEDAKWAA